MKLLKKFKHDNSLRDIVSLWVGQGISNVFTTVYGVALAWYVIELTGSSLQMGLILLVSILPKLFFSMFSGVLGDRINKKKLLINLNIIRFIVTLLWGISLFFREITIVEIYFFTIIFSTIDAFFYPIYSALIPEILNNKNLSRAASFNQMIVRIATIISPSLAGILIIFIPLKGFILINALGFIIAAFFTMRIKHKSNVAEIENKNIFKDLKLGFRYFYKKKTIFWSVILITLANIGVVSYNVNLANYINNELNASPKVYGITLTFFSMGSFITLLALSIIKIEKNRGFIYLLSLFIGGVFFILIPWANNILYIYLIFFIIGLSFAVTSTISTTILFAESDEKYRSRILGIASISSFLSPIGYLMWGIIGDKFSPSLAMGTAGLIIIFTVLVGLRTSLRSYN